MALPINELQIGIDVPCFPCLFPRLSQGSSPRASPRPTVLWGFCTAYAAEPLSLIQTACQVRGNTLQKLTMKQGVSATPSGDWGILPADWPPSQVGWKTTGWCDTQTLRHKGFVSLLCLLLHSVIHKSLSFTCSLEPPSK